MSSLLEIYSAFFIYLRAAPFGLFQVELRDERCWRAAPYQRDDRLTPVVEVLDECTCLPGARLGLSNCDVARRVDANHGRESNPALDDTRAVHVIIKRNGAVMISW